MFQLTALSFPATSDLAKITNEIVTEHAANVLSEFTEKFSATLHDYSPSLLSYIRRRLAEPHSFNEMWDISYGGAYAALLRTDDLIHHRAILLALRLAEYGQIGNWEASLSEPLYFRIGGSWLLADSQINLTSSHRRLEIVTGPLHSPRRFCFEGNGELWTCLQGAVQRVTSIGPKSPWRLMGPPLLSRWELSDIGQNVENNLLDNARYFADARELLSERCPLYSRWVEKVVRAVAPWKTKGRQFPSGSSSSNCAPGLIGVGSHDNVLSLAESIVHEASHQYLYIGKRMGTLSKKASSELFFNPILGINRPIEMIVLSYHAFGNVLFFLRGIKPRTEQESVYCTEREVQLVPQLQQLEAAIRRSNNISSVGRDLFEPLSEAICV